MKEVKLAKILLDKPPPLVSSTNWAVYDMKNSTLLYGKHERERKEVASLTKIMTLYVCFRLLERFQLNEHETRIQISDCIYDVIGTSADLVLYDSFTLWELFYGLMLPSGNDAAI